MNHIILLFICCLSVEIFIRSNYVPLINSTIYVSKKAISIILNKNISDHWKENIIPKYSLQMMKYSLQMLLTISLIIFIFIIADDLYSGFLAFTLSWKGIIRSILIAFSYCKYIFATFRFCHYFTEHNRIYDIWTDFIAMESQ